MMDFLILEIPSFWGRIIANQAFSSKMSNLEARKDVE